jgi:tRNA(Ile)-lysidine synthase
LGNACRELDARHLFLAHHLDDQAETILMRIAEGKKSRAIVGMSSVGNIPECYGIHGVHQSGGCLVAITPPASLPPGKNQQQKDRMSIEAGKPQINDRKVLALPAYCPEESIRSIRTEKAVEFSNADSIRLDAPLCEEGGVRVFRPLLAYRKAELVATCNSEAMEWFEDVTNADPTLTTRNAVRRIYQKYALPATLAPVALVNIANDIRQVVEHNIFMVKREFHEQYHNGLDTRTGTLITSLTFDSAVSLNDPESSDQILSGRRMKSAILLRGIIQCLSPQEHVPMAKVMNKLMDVFPQLNSANEQIIEATKTFTVAGVKFELLETRRSANIKSHQNESPGTEPVFGDNTWRISRQPYTADISTHPLLVFLPHVKGSYLPLSKVPKWRLYDGRYWITIKNLGCHTLHVRPFRKEDLQPFLEGLDKTTLKTAKGLLKDFAPGPIRWTLPAIVSVDEANVERVVALPSLGIRTDSARPVFDYDIRFKKISDLI